MSFLLGLELIGAILFSSNFSWAWVALKIPLYVMISSSDPLGDTLRHSVCWLFEPPPPGISGRPPGQSPSPTPMPRDSGPMMSEAVINLTDDR